LFYPVTCPHPTFPLFNANLTHSCYSLYNLRALVRIVALIPTVGQVQVVVD
jgi:hypothetical protein